MGAKPIDITGLVSGRLRVLEFSHCYKEAAFWIALCDPELGGCGNAIAIRGRNIRKGFAKSCGCLQRERAAETGRKYIRVAQRHTSKKADESGTPRCDCPERKPTRRMCASCNHLWVEFKLTKTQYVAMWESQGGVCAICCVQLTRRTKGAPMGEGDAVVDHDHASGTVRSILCHSCNKGLGQFKDNPDLLRSAAAYLETYNSVQVRGAA